MDNKNLFADGIVDSCSPRKKTRAENEAVITPCVKVSNSESSADLVTREVDGGSKDTCYTSDELTSTSLEQPATVADIFKNFVEDFAKLREVFMPLFEDSVLFEEEILGRLEPLSVEADSLESSAKGELRASHLRLSDIIAHLAE